ncbi:MAG TPA: hypothetical protein VFT90_17765 [Chryseosolibacter sp.]|nr:hypothetical protein [Chryseosolibacter sp.]
MARLALILLIFTCISVDAFSQGEENSLKGLPLKDRIVTGGGLGLGFGSVQDYFSVSPMIGYRLTARLLAGTGLTYRYTNYKVTKPSIKLNDYGVNPFLRFTVYRNIFLQTEFEHLNYEFPITTVESTRQTFNSFLAGGGFIQPLGERFAFYLMALYNFSYQEQSRYSPYDSPIVIRAGINIGALGL